MTTETFFYQFVNELYCDPRDRPKTFKALQRFAETIPQDEWNDLPNFTVYAPGDWIRGQAVSGISSMIYLAPSLEKKPQWEVDFTVAHEFAHLVLGHNEFITASAKPVAYLKMKSEKAADRLAKKWGYRIPARRNP